MAASTELLPGPVEEGGNSKEGSPEVKKKPRGRPRKNGPEPCRSAANKADFFMPISWRKQQQKEASETSKGRGTEVPMGDSTPAKNKRCRQDSGASGVDDVVSKRVQVGKCTQDMAKGPSPVKRRTPSPAKLQVGRKLAVEEDAPHAAVKRLHPFFSRQVPARSKISKPSEPQHGTVGSSGSMGSQISSTGGLWPCPPFHVTQLAKVESIPSEWTFPVVEACKAGIGSYNVPDDNPEGFLLCRNGKLALPSLDEVLGQFNRYLCSTLVSRHAALEHGVSGGKDEVNCCAEQQEDTLLRYLTHGSLDPEEQPRFQDHCHEPDHVLSRERLRTRAASLKACRLATKNIKTSERKGMCALSANLLWTDLYQPKSPPDVCGNSRGVGLLNSWLASWQKKILSGRRSVLKAKRKLVDKSDEDDDRSWEGDSGSDCSDSDSESRKECLSNTLLLTGPVGCGKSAAVYACANEQGFSVIEVSSADLRNGSLIKQKFGEALESHGLRKWSASSGDGQAASLQKSDSSSQTRPESVRAQISSAEARLGCSEGARELEVKSRKLTVILFEDVDVIFDEDRGFTSALVKLAATTKRPIILTSNKRCPALPLPLRKLIIEFNQPSTQSLVLHACMVTNAEGVAFCPQLMECIVKACRHDIRQVMMVLQFWTQGDVVDVQGRCGQRQPREVGHGEAVAGDTSSCAEALTRLRSLLLPLSFPFSLLGNVATKVSEAAMQLHLCATYAGVIKTQDLNEPILSASSCKESGTVKDAANGFGADALDDDRVGATSYVVCNSPVKSLRGLRAAARSIKLMRAEDTCSDSAASRPQNVASCFNQQDSGCEALEEPLCLGMVGHAVLESLGRECILVCSDGLGKIPDPASDVSGATVCEVADFNTYSSAADSKEAGQVSPKRVLGTMKLSEQVDGQEASTLLQLEKPVREECLGFPLSETMSKLSPQSIGLQDMPSSLSGTTLFPQVCREQAQVAYHSLSRGRLKTSEAGDTSQELEPDDLLLNIFSQSSSDTNSATKEMTREPLSESNMSSLEVVATMARLTDDLSFFDAMSSHSAWEVEDLEASTEQHFGFHRDSLEDEAAYLVDRSVHLCRQQCSRLLEFANPDRSSLNSSDMPQGMQIAEMMSGALNWLASDANPCDVDHGIRRAAREAMLRNIVHNLLPTRTKAAAAAGPGLHDYTSSLARICKLEQRRQAASGKQLRPGTRRSGRGFLHYLASSVPEHDIACLLSHAKLERGFTKSYSK